MQRTFLPFTLLMLSLCTSSALADQVMFRFTGEISYVSAEPQVAAVFQVGDPFSISYIFDTTTPNTGSPTSARYNTPVTLIFDYNHGQYLGHAAQVLLQVTDDLYEVFGGEFFNGPAGTLAGFPSLGTMTARSFAIDIGSFSGTTLFDDVSTIPTDIPFPLALKDRDFALIFQPSTIDDGGVLGEITGFTATPLQSFPRHVIRYRATPLPYTTNLQLSNSQVRDFNRTGQMLIDHYVPTPGSPQLLQTALVEADGSLVPISPLGSDLSVYGRAINDAGDVVATSFQNNQQPNTSQRDSFFLPHGGSKIELPILDHGSEVADVNNHDIIVGHSYSDPDGNFHWATVWVPNGSGGFTIRNLGDFDRDFSLATAINDDNQILVRAFDFTTFSTNFRYLLVDEFGQILKELPYFPSAINNQGQILFSTQKLLWDQDSDTWHYIPTAGSLQDLNNRGFVIAGSAYSSGGTTLWHADSATLYDEIQDLLLPPHNRLQVRYLDLINDRGQILAKAYDPDNPTSESSQPAWLFTPVPQVLGMTRNPAPPELDITWFVLGDQYDWTTTNDFQDWPIQESGIIPPGFTIQRTLPITTDPTQNYTRLEMSQP